MDIEIKVHLNYQVPQPCMVLMQLEAADLAQQRILDRRLELAGNPQIHRLEAGDGVGERIWLQADGRFDCSYRANVAVSRPTVDLTKVQATPLQHLPAPVIRYLLPSRYCPINEFDGLSLPDFGNHQGGALIDAMARWICENFTYDIGASDATTTAQQSFLQRRGVCRDYAHVLISLARAIGIPARYASVYSPDVDPMDFHAVVEVFLDNAWHMVDPTGMSQPQRTAVVGVGRDATDVAFLTSFGDMHLVSQRVDVRLVDSQS
ncbi:MAG: transglutaminase family protein [Rhizobiaceae bacterium]